MYKILSTCKGGGYTYCRTSPPHPKRNTKGLYPLHRVIMANKLGRDLLPNEIAHHKDENKDNNDPENVGLKTRSNHSKHHSKKIELIKLTCPQCSKGFYLKPFQYRLRMRRTEKGQPCCSRECSGLFNKHKATGKTMVKLTCPQCGDVFKREKRRTHLSKGGKYTACSKSCSGKFSALLKTGSFIEKIEKNVIKIYVE